MKQIIYGVNPVSKELKWYIEHDTNDEIIAFTVERAYKKEDSFCGKPLIAFEELDKTYNMNDISILVSIGYHQMNDIRKKVFQMCEEKGYTIGEFIHSTANIAETKRGKGNLIFDNVQIHPFVELGSGNIIGSRVFISHDSCIQDFNFMTVNVCLGGMVHIGNNNFFGLGAIIGDGIHVNDYNLIGAGTIISKNIECNRLIMPSPAREREVSKRLLDSVIERW